MGFSNRPPASRVLPRLAAILLTGGAAICLAATTRLAAAQAPFSLDVEPPELVGGPWINTPGDKPITLASRKGQVTIVHFWTFG